MATITKREGKRGTTYNVQIRLRNQKAFNQSYKTLREAKLEAQRIEMEMRAGRHGASAESRKKTLGAAIDRYQKYVLPSVKKSRREHIIEWWQKTIGHLPLKDITRALVAEIRDKLIHEEVDGKKKAAATVVKYLTTLSHILTICVNEWQWLETNPVMKVSKPSLPKGRIRFLSDEEREKLLQACMESKNPYLYTIVVLSISTGMRRSVSRQLRLQVPCCLK